MKGRKGGRGERKGDMRRDRERVLPLKGVDDVGRRVTSAGAAVKNAHEHEEI